MHKARDRPKACMLQVKVLKKIIKTNNIYKIIKFNRVLIFTLTVRRRCSLETFYLRQRCFPDLRISVEVVLVLTLVHIVLRQRKQPSKISWMSILVERVNVCTDIHDKALIQELPLKSHVKINIQF